MTDMKPMRIDDALSMMATSAGRCADALERIAAAYEANRSDAADMRAKLEETFIKLHNELKAAMPAVEEVAAIVEQAVEEKSDESEEEEDEEHMRQPAAVEAPAEPEPTPAAEQAAPEEVKQEEIKDEPAASDPAAEAEAEQAEPDLDIVEYANAMRALNAKYNLPEEVRRRIQQGIREQFGIEAIVECEPPLRRKVIALYESALQKLEADALNAKPACETA